MTESSRPWRRRLVRIFVAVLALAVVFSILDWDVRTWLSDLWDVLTSVSPVYLIAGVAFATLQTVATAVGWYWILRTAYGKENVARREIMACYATAVALNGFLPANLGTFVSLLMFVAVIAGATFSGILGGYAVQKIFYVVSGAFVYLYLFLSVDGSFDIKFEWVSDHKTATVLILLGGIGLIVLIVWLLRARLAKFWAKAKQGGQVLARPSTYLGRVMLPQFIGWCASLATIAVFLAAYAIPVTFHTVMSVVGGNSIANVTSFTPGGIGVNQAFNVASLNGVTDATTATAYSVAHQVVITAWNQIVALLLVVWVFGWSGGKELVGESYADAKRQAAERTRHKRSGAKAESA